LVWNSFHVSNHLMSSTVLDSDICSICPWHRINYLLCGWHHQIQSVYDIYVSSIHAAQVWAGEAACPQARKGPSGRATAAVAGHEWPGIGGSICHWRPWIRIRGAINIDGTKWKV
jgi:hypothetical protein